MSSRTQIVRFVQVSVFEHVLGQIIWSYKMLKSIDGEADMLVVRLKGPTNWAILIPLPLGRQAYYYPLSKWQHDPTI